MSTQENEGTRFGGPACPFEFHNQTRSHQEGFFGTPDLAPGASQQFAGMTLRDYFAAKALQAIIQTWPQLDERPTNETALLSLTAIDSYQFADAMLKARQS